MRSIVLLLAASLLLAACLPPSGDAPTPSLTPDTSHLTPATPTPVPTSTPHPDFLALQEQIAAGGETFTLTQDGQIEMWTEEEGARIVPGIQVHPDGTMTFTHEGQEYEVDTETLEIQDQTITFRDTNGRTWILDGEKLLETFTLDELAQMTSAEKLKNAPEIEGYEAFRAAERYVLYESKEGVRDIAYDLTTTERVTIPEYPICRPEKFYECEISQEDLMNGKYWLWLNTLDVKFDPEKIKWDVPIVFKDYDIGDWVKVKSLYHDSGYSAPPDFADPSTAPFDRDVTAGVVLYDVNGIKSFGIVRPVAFFDKATNDVNWVVVLQSYHYYVKVGNNPSEDDPRSPRYKWVLDTWLYHYNVTPLMTNYFSISSGMKDPVLSHTYEVYPDVEERFAKFAGGDVSALSAPGLVVQTSSHERSYGNTYK